MKIREDNTPITLTTKDMIDQRKPSKAEVLAEVKEINRLIQTANEDQEIVLLKRYWELAELLRESE